MTAPKEQGFTLTELMIAMVIIGILIAVAIPQYNEYVCRTRRGQAEALLAATSASLSKYFAINKSYAGINNNILADFGLSQIPTFSSDGNNFGHEAQRYKFLIKEKNNTKFCLEAESSEILTCGPDSGKMIMRFDSLDSQVRYCRCGSSDCKNEAKQSF